MRPSNITCPRCTYRYDGDNPYGKYAEVKTIPCPYCQRPAKREKAIYRQSKLEKYVCTNELCKVRYIRIVSTKEGEREI